MKVLFDHQIFEAQTFGGISRYFNELISTFCEHPDIETILPPMYSDNVYIQNNPNFTILKLNKSEKKFPKNIYTYIHPRRAEKKRREEIAESNLKSSITVLKKSEFDIFHPTYYDPYFTKYIGSKPFVITIHDLIYEKFPGFFSENNPTRQNIKMLAERSSRIIAVSENTKKDIIQSFGIPPDKIDVIYHGNSLPYAGGSRLNKIPLPDNYLLFVGTRRLYKNFDFFIKSISPLLQEIKNLHVICLGGGKFSRSEKKLLKNLQIIHKVLHFFPETDEELSFYYANASAFCFPSKYEGFGFPILEAFVNNCPVIASNTSSLPEVAGDASCYFDPNNSKSIINSIRYVLNDPLLKNKLIARGLIILKNFSWIKTANATKKVYYHALL